MHAAQSPYPNAALRSLAGPVSPARPLIQRLAALLGEHEKAHRAAYAAAQPRRRLAFLRALYCGGNGSFPER